MDESLASLPEPSASPNGVPDAGADGVDEHVVFFTAGDGAPEAERHPSLASAVGRVEALCNDDGVTDAVVFSLTPVPLTKRQLWRVEVGPAPAPARTDPTDAGTDPTDARTDPTAARTDPTDARTDPPAASATLAPPTGPTNGVTTTPDVGPATRPDAPEDPSRAGAEVLPTPSAQRGRGTGFFVH